MSFEGIVGAITSIVCAVISGILLHMFKTKKDKDDEHLKKRVEADIAERKMILSIASAVKILLRKADNEKLNGDIQNAKADLETKKGKLEDMASESYFTDLNQ